MALLSSHREARWGRIRVHTTLYLHAIDYKSYQSLQTSPLISYATIVWNEPQFALLHTVIDLKWQSSALIRSSASAEAASGHIRHCICMRSTVDNKNCCRHPLWYHIRQFVVLVYAHTHCVRLGRSTERQDEATSEYIRHCICMRSHVYCINRCRHPLWYHMRL